MHRSPKSNTDDSYLTLFQFSTLCSWPSIVNVVDQELIIGNYLAVDCIAILAVPVILSNIAGGNAAGFTIEANHNAVNCIGKPGEVVLLLHALGSGLHPRLGNRYLESNELTKN